MSSKFKFTLRMAVRLRQNNFYIKKPDPIVLKDISREINHIELPNIPDSPLILLPPPEHSLTRNNFQIYSEDILHNLNNTKSQSNEQKFEEEFHGKRHSMIGLKRRDNEDKNNLVLRKKMRLSHNQASKSQLKSKEEKQVSSYKTNINSRPVQEVEDMQNILYNENDEEEDLEINRADHFLNQEEMDEYNYHDNTF
jgi:hypothetical protein